MNPPVPDVAEQQPGAAEARPPDPSAGPSLKDWANDGGQTPAERAKRLVPGEKPGTSRVPFPVRPDGDEFKREVHRLAGSVAKKTHDAPIALVNLKDLDTFQHHVNDERLVQHLDDPDMVMPGTRGSGHGGLVDKPIVIRKDGKLTIWDGNHRLTAAHLRGQDTAKVRLIDVVDGPGTLGEDRAT